MTTAFVDYCDHHPKHLLCDDQLPSEAKCPNYTRLPLSEDLKQDIVEIHNYVRILVAKGELKGKYNKSLPTAKNLMAMVRNDSFSVR